MSNLIEIVNKRGWDSKVFNTGRVKPGVHEGDPDLPIYGTKIQNGLHDKNPDGSYDECDMSIEESTDGVTYLKAKRGRWGQMRFGDSSHPNSFLVKIKNRDIKGVSFKYTGAIGESMTANNGKPLCNFDNGISIEATPYYKGVKMDIIVNDPLTAPLEYPFSVKTYGQAYSFIEENGGATLKGEDQDPIFIKPPFAVDANGDIGEVSIQYTGLDGNLITFKKVVDEVWLRQAAAPVRIDPDVTIDDDSGTLIDTIFTNSGATASWNYGASAAFTAHKQTVGNEGTGAIKVDLTSLSGITVTNAYIGLDVYAKVGASYSTKVFEVLKAWIEGTKNGAIASAGEPTWTSQIHSSNPAWASGGCQGSGTDHNATEESSTTVTAINNDVHFALTAATVQGHIDNPPTNNGYVFISQDITGLGAYWSARSSQAVLGNKPYFYIEYTGGEGGRSPIRLLLLLNKRGKK